MLERKKKSGSVRRPQGQTPPNVQEYRKRDEFDRGTQTGAKKGGKGKNKGANNRTGLVREMSSQIRRKWIAWKPRANPAFAKQ